ncbi:MAG: type II toxin-antitoxin system RelE/ParE family toxin [Candidatus Competibacteraceae bacterium]|nr:MAG: type II toxin-antitoxin system RelE/ParE family toxin [Candidatus Competibacteraceae bacterium]
MKICWTRPAARDLEAIQDHIARDNPMVAGQLAATIRQRIQQLQDHPQLGRPGRVPGTRELVIGGTPYVVPYRVKNQQVEILALYHGARRWPEQF